MNPPKILNAFKILSKFGLQRDFIMDNSDALAKNWSRIITSKGFLEFAVNELSADDLKMLYSDSYGAGIYIINRSAAVTDVMTMIDPNWTEEIINKLKTNEDV